MRQKATQNVAHNMCSTRADRSLSTNNKQIKRGNTSLIHRAFFRFFEVREHPFLKDDLSGFPTLGRKKNQADAKVVVFGRQCDVMERVQGRNAKT